MRIDELVGIALRRWPVVLVGAVCTLLVAWAALTGVQPLYWTQSDELFLAPGGSAGGPTEDTTQEALISFAAAVEREVNAGQDVVRLSSPSVTLYGAGVRRGHSVALPDVGGQWESSFTRPVLSVQVVDSGPDAVRERLDEVRARIRSAATELQRAQGVPDDARITVVSVPPDPYVADVGSTRGSRARGLLAVAVVGAVATTAALVVVDHLARQRQRRAPAQEVHAGSL